MKNQCSAKYFGGAEITRRHAVKIIKNLVFTSTMGDIQELKEDRRIPACVKLFVAALLNDMTTGQLDTVLGVIDSAV
jgi:hypothetical protein